jgi:hypothetical protein
MPRVEVLLFGLPHKMFWQQGVADDVSGQRKEIHVSVGISCDEGDSWLIFELVWHQILRSGLTTRGDGRETRDRRRCEQRERTVSPSFGRPTCSRRRLLWRSSGRLRCIRLVEFSTLLRHAASSSRTRRRLFDDGVGGLSALLGCCGLARLDSPIDCCWSGGALRKTRDLWVHCCGCAGTPCFHVVAGASPVRR